AAINTVMTVPADRLPSYLGLEQPDGAYAIIHVLGASSANSGGDAARAGLEKVILERTAAAEESEYVQALRERFDARVLRTDLRGAGKGGNSPSKP
ncbi:MAG TPA: hypothetical protein VED85_01095, partial [Burkholderiaceae bacterium]|nr:hypothetical protein [Burkholderiaceae bacterium]